MTNLTTFTDSLAATKTRFWAKVLITDDFHSCWIWKGALSKRGLGVFSVGTGQWLARRVAWVLGWGPASLPLRVKLRCGNTKCVRPSHLCATGIEFPWQKAMWQAFLQEKETQIGKKLDGPFAQKYKGHTEFMLSSMFMNWWDSVRWERFETEVTECDRRALEVSILADRPKIL